MNTILQPGTQPVAQQKNHLLTRFNDHRNDPYYWLRHRENPEVIDYLKLENDYTARTLEPFAHFEKSLFNEIKSRIKEEDESVPVFENGYWYYLRYHKDKEYPVYYRKKHSLDGIELVLLDVNILADNHDFCNLSNFEISPNNNFMAYAVDFTGRNLFEIYITNLETKETFNYTLKSAWGAIIWANDSTTLFYDTKDEITLRSNKVLLHELGKPNTDTCIFEEKDEMFNVGIGKSASKAFIFIETSSTLSSETHFIDANNPYNHPKCIQARSTDLLYSVEHHNNKFIILTNQDEAKNFKLMHTPIEATEATNWVNYIHHRADVLIEAVDVFAHYHIITERSKGLIQLRVIDLKNTSEHYIDFGEPAYDAFLADNPEYETTTIRFGYTSLTTPRSTYEYNLQTRLKTLLKEQAVIGDFDKNNYLTQRIYATANDGVQVPISLVYHKHTPIDGTAPLLVYGYGAYGVSIDASFSSARLSLLNRGFVFAIAHIRGGQELGRNWYENGKFLFKKNTFTDFIACAHHLIDLKYGNRHKVFGFGGSAGGLLMGAVANLEPNLWCGIVSAVPFVDVLTTMLDPSIPLTTSEYEEWGNPEDETYYHYIKSYSPYDNIEAKNYPNMLITTGFHDSQVQYWEPAKYVAKLRQLKTDNNILLLHTNLNAGHGGASGRYESLKETAKEYCFILVLAGINQ